MKKNRDEKLKELYDKISTPEEKILDLLEEINREKLKGDKGDKGDDYILTDEDKEEIASKIDVPIVEKVTTTIEKYPIITNEIKEVAKYETAEAIRDKITSLKGIERLSVYALKDLEWLGKKGDKIQWSSAGFKVYTDSTLTGDGSSNNPLHSNNTSGGGGGGGTWYQDEVPSGTKNGSNVTFTLAHSPTSVVFLYLNGQYQVSGGADYSRSGTTITMTTAPLSTDVLVANYS